MQTSAGVQQHHTEGGRKGGREERTDGWMDGWIKEEGPTESKSGFLVLWLVSLILKQNKRPMLKYLLRAGAEFTAPALFSLCV